MKLAVFDRMEECTDAEVQRMLLLVSPQRREQALRYKHTLGRFCCIKSWLMLNQLMADSQIPMPDWQYNEHGKPFLPNGPYFSISHCKDGIAVVVDNQPIGVDIESLRSANQDLIERTMNAEEQAQIAEAADRERAFIRLWTQKEAVVKAQGRGIESFEQLQNVLSIGGRIDSFETEKYIYSIAYGELSGFRP